ncbi:hypothetical protein [Virgibacillus kimchii]
MKPTKLTPLNKAVEVKYTQQSVPLSLDRKREVEKFWAEVNEGGSFYRGEAFHVDAVMENEHAFRIMLKQTDYAHYLHTVRNHITDEEGCRIVFGAGLAETKDKKFVFGEMAEHTAYPGRLQCAGGGLSWEDVKGNDFDMKHSVLRELQEEMGIVEQTHVETCTPVYLKSGGTHDFFVILYHIKLQLTEKEVINMYGDFADSLSAAGEQPEFQQLIFLENNKETITHFFETDERQCVDYLKPFLKQMAH